MEVQGTDLKQDREKVKASRQEVALRLGVTYSMVQRIEEGWKEMPAGFPERYRQVLREIAGERMQVVA